MNTLNLKNMKNLKEKIMNKNVLRVAFSIGAAVIALSTSAYTNRLVTVIYHNQASGSSTTAADYEYQPGQSCSAPNARNCEFEVTLENAPSPGSNPTQAQLNTAIAGGAGNISEMRKGNLLD